MLNFIFLRSFTNFSSNFFLLTPSPWPLFAAIGTFTMLFGFTCYFNFYTSTLFIFLFGLFILVFVFVVWVRDLIRELIFLNRFSTLIELNARWGFWLFIVSEAMLFFSFFWAFFHSALEPAFQLGNIWPPVEIQMNSLLVPALNTIFLLLSGAALTWMQYGLLAGSFFETIWGFICTFILAFFFMAAQVYEYIVAFHQVNDSVFGSTLYVLTVFHGFHVFIGTVFLIVCFIRFLFGHFRGNDFTAVTLAAWYWHFVDIIWIIVFCFIYLWGTLDTLNATSFPTFNLNYSDFLYFITEKVLYTKA